ncbi:MAG: OmpA family protein [Bdellovibrionales bacterium]
MKIRSRYTLLCKPLALSLVLLTAAAETTSANICGSDFQNFNPTSSGLDFVTVHSSETLKPCVINLGLFTNYAANTLSYSQNYAGSTTNSGSQANDRIFAGDLSAGFGLTPHWDAGIGLPFIISQRISDPGGSTFYNKNGLNEIKLNTKYRFLGDESGGVAGVLSFNFNLIKNNPFTGSGAGPTTNFEAVFDHTFGDFAVAANFGYRWRQPGDTIPNQPFTPLKDQIIYSVAGNYLIPGSDSKVILEFFGSRAAHAVDYDSNRSLNALEWLLGLKHDFTHSLAFHIGGGTEIGNSLGSPDWRLYTGLNWAIGPVCDEPKSSRGMQVQEDHELFVFSSEVLFGHNSDQIRGGYMAEIDEFAEKLKSTGFKRIVIEGHTDSVGREDYNLILSERRALAVKNYLIEKHGFNEAQIETLGYGETRPIADNGNFQGRQRNRRVEFKVWR